jgi:hypothetical protein
VASTSYPWEGREWQDYCTQLLYLHHDARYQPIPDQDRGDGGLEGFSTDGTGCGYQCHAPKAHYGIVERRTQQVAKIKGSVGKLIDNRVLLGRLVGTHVIREVRFLFPVCESRELVAVVREQEARLIAAVAEHEIAWLSADVVISAHQGDELLAAEMAKLERAGASHARLPAVTVPDDEVDRHLEAAAAELTGAAAKLRERFGDGRVPRLLRVALADHLVGKELAAHLESHNPQTHEDYARVMAERRTRVQRESLEGATADRTLTDLGDELTAAITESVAGLHTEDARHLAQGVIADWLIECPLSFGTTGAGSR